MSQDFSKGKIYKITNDFNDEVYVGSTCDTLVKRFSKHKREINCALGVNRPLYILMREIGTDRFRIQLVEEYPCEDKYQLGQREGYYIRQIGTLNARIAGRTPKEYQKEHIEDFQERSRIWEQKEESKQKRIQYRENIGKQYYQCECGCEITRQSISKHSKTKKHLKLREIKNSV